MQLSYRHVHENELISFQILLRQFFYLEKKNVQRNNCSTVHKSFGMRNKI